MQTVTAIFHPLCHLGWIHEHLSFKLLVVLSIIVLSLRKRTHIHARMHTQCVSCYVHPLSVILALFVSVCPVYDRLYPSSNLAGRIARTPILSSVAWALIEGRYSLLCELLSISGCCLPYALSCHVRLRLSAWYSLVFCLHAHYSSLMCTCVKPSPIPHSYYYFYTNGWRSPRFLVATRVSSISTFSGCVSQYHNSVSVQQCPSFWFLLEGSQIACSYQTTSQQSFLCTWCLLYCCFRKRFLPLFCTRIVLFGQIVTFCVALITDTVSPFNNTWKNDA